MTPRDVQLVEQVLREPYSGYAHRPGRSFRPDLDRVAACVFLLGTMVISGVLLGSPQRRPESA